MVGMAEIEGSFGGLFGGRVFEGRHQSRRMGKTCFAHVEDPPQAG